MAKFNALQLQHIQYLEYERRQLTLATQTEVKKARYHPGAIDAAHEHLGRLQQQLSDQENVDAGDPSGSKLLIH